MADKQYDVSPEFRKLFERKQKQRMEYRNYFLKNITNPYRHATGEGGHVVSKKLPCVMHSRSTLSRQGIFFF